MLYCLVALTEVPMVQLALLFLCKSDVNRNADQRFSLFENVERERYGLMGEIPGAYTQAFCFEEFMDDDAELDDEVETLRQGMVAMKFSKELKQEIRRPWARALIVKVYGRAVGLNFLQARLLSLWKPAGRLDVVDLEHGFFFIRLSLKEDVENVLKKGPWFIGDHFLSIRPWEPDFKPESAKVSSITVWIRLSGLPIKYYNAKGSPTHLEGYWQCVKD